MRFSIGAGATYLPLAVLNSSFPAGQHQQAVGAALAQVAGAEEAVVGEALGVSSGRL
jgi:hypothetical protein